tara:strand:+ start:734 stop:880 length:147 start_codon:yes stop_codon:yes gene_type:complete
MAKKKGINFTAYVRPPKKKRKGIHSKNLSRSKGSKQYKKPYRSQGKTR